MDSTSIITQVTREDELLNTFPASEKGKQVCLQVVSKMALKRWNAGAPACLSVRFVLLGSLCNCEFMSFDFFTELENSEVW